MPDDGLLLELPESPAYVTLAGLILERLGHIPSPGQSLRVEPYRLTVLGHCEVEHVHFSWSSPSLAG